MLKNKKKKGFTIVELVIVIAVIGILAAILIPTFINLTARANRISNESFVRNINTQLAMDDAENNKHSEASGALAAAKKIGFHVDDITPYEGNDIVWDEVHDRFAIVKGDFAQPGNQNADHVVFADSTFDPTTPLHKLWKFYDTMPAPAEQTYSIAAKKSWNTKNVADLKVGFDACKVPDIESVSYIGGNSAQDVVIRTNSASTTLTINAEHDTVNHYGNVGKVDTQKIDMNCYNEFGKAAYIKVTEGKVVAKAGGKIEVVFAANNNKDAVAVIKETNGTIERGLTVIESVSTTNEARTNGIPLEFSVDGVTAASKTAEELATELTTRTTAVEAIAVDVIETAVEKEAVEADESDFWIVCHADEFASGSGTEQDPYIIKTPRQLSLLAYNVNTLKAGFASAWYKLGKDIDLSGKAWTPIGTTNGTDTLFFTGHFDGNGKSIIGLTNNGKSDADLGLYSDELSSVKGLAASYGLFGYTQDVEISDLTMKSAKIEGSSYFKEAGIVIGMATGSVVMTDCSIDQNSLIYGKSKIGGFIGYMNNGDSDNGKGGDVAITDCDFAGTIKVSENRAGSIIGAHSEYQSGYALGHTYTFTDCDTTGHLYANESTNGYGLGLIGYAYQGTSSIQNGTEYFAKFIFDNCTNAATMSATINESTGKYVGRAVQTGLFIVKNTTETLPQGLIGQVQAGPWIISINGNYFGTRGVDSAYISLGTIEESPIEICQVISPQGAYATQAPQGKVYRLSTDSMEIDDNDCLVLKANAAINFHDAKNTIQDQLEMFQNNANIADGYHIEVLSPWSNKMSEKGHWAFSIVANSD